jgi:hypothetical protein
MDPHSIKKSFFLYLLLSGLFFSSFADLYEVNAEELLQIAQSGETEESDEEEDEDC